MVVVVYNVDFAVFKIAFNFIRLHFWISQPIFGCWRICGDMEGFVQTDTRGYIIQFPIYSITFVKTFLKPESRHIYRNLDPNLNTTNR